MSMLLHKILSELFFLFSTDLYGTVVVFVFASVSVSVIHSMS